MAKLNRDAAPLALIAAVARNGVIGRAGRMPWHLPQDMQRFRLLTAGCPVIMGRRTWDSLPVRFRPLPDRVNIVVTRNAGWGAVGALSVPSLDAALMQAQQSCKPGHRIFVLGGAQIYAEALPLADELELTEIGADVEGDTRFPTWDRRQFEEVQRLPYPASPDGTPAFDFVTFRRIR